MVAEQPRARGSPSTNHFEALLSSTVNDTVATADVSTPSLPVYVNESMPMKPAFGQYPKLPATLLLSSVWPIPSFGFAQVPLCAI